MDFNSRHTKCLLAVEASALLIGISGEAEGRILMLAVNRLGESGGLVFSTFRCCVDKHELFCKRTPSLKLSAVQGYNQSHFAETLAPDISSSLDA